MASDKLPSSMLPTMPPHEAGRKIRQLAKAASNNVPPAGVGGSSFQKFSYSFSNESSIASLQDQATRARQRVMDAAKTRRVSEVESALKEYSRSEQLVYRTLKASFLDYAENLIRRHNERVDSGFYASGSSSVKIEDKDTGEMMTLHQVLERISLLTQSFPTQPDLPSTDSKDIALRAIVAVLRVHKFPGSEDLSHEPIKEVEDGSAHAGVKIDLDTVTDSFS